MTKRPRRRMTKRYPAKAKRPTQWTIHSDTLTQATIWLMDGDRKTMLMTLTDPANTGAWIEAFNKKAAGQFYMEHYHVLGNFAHIRIAACNAGHDADANPVLSDTQISEILALAEDVEFAP